jgi:hypothetical protein
MNTKFLIRLSMLIVCLNGFQGAQAEKINYASVFANEGVGHYFRAQYFANINGASKYGNDNSGSKTSSAGYLKNNGNDNTWMFQGDYATSGFTYGGYFFSWSTRGVGVYGSAEAADGITYGGYFINKSINGIGLYGCNSATSGASYGGYFNNASPRGTGVVGEASAYKGNTCGVLGKAYSKQGYGVYSQGDMKVVGKFTCTGTKSSVVALKNGEEVSLYAIEASENWFEDCGSSTLIKGRAVVEIDPLYAKTVNSETTYHVFLTPEADCKGLYVTNKKPASFEVKELNGGQSSIPFSYRIMAKRKGFENLRLEKIPVE